MIVKVDILISFLFFFPWGVWGGGPKCKQTNQKLISPKSPKMLSIHLTKRKRALALAGKNLFHFSATPRLLWGRTGEVDTKEVCCIELYWTEALWLLFTTQLHLTRAITLGEKSTRQYRRSATAGCDCGCWVDECVVIQTEVEGSTFFSVSGGRKLNVVALPAESCSIDPV